MNCLKYYTVIAELRPNSPDSYLGLCLEKDLCQYKWMCTFHTQPLLNVALYFLRSTKPDMYFGLINKSYLFYKDCRK